MDKNLTDNEIIKALECCGVEDASCRKCIFNLQNNCRILLAKEALDLINRLQAENKSQSIMIKMLNGSIEDYKKSYIEQKAEIENYKQIAEHQQSVTLERGFEIKRLKEKIESLQAENEKLKKTKYIFSTVDYCADDLEKALKENESLKAEIERLKEIIKNLEQSVYEKGLF